MTAIQHELGLLLYQCGVYSLFDLLLCCALAAITLFLVCASVRLIFDE